MVISSIILATRFGFGVRAGHDLPRSVDQMLDSGSGRDPLARRFKTPSFLERRVLYREIQTAKADEKNGVRGASDKVKNLNRQARDIIRQDMQNYIARAAFSEFGFRERLVTFWLDHFTVSGKNLRTLLSNGAYVEEAIRPNLTGSFAEILKAIVVHPAMLQFLDQVSSIGPNSRSGQRTGRGLNENLAREILELHTMGVDGSYSQNDVREFAELLTGLTIGENGTKFNGNISEPGEVQILGQRYGARKSKLSHILEFLDDLAVHPETAGYIAHKLAVHFVSETPDAGLVEDLTAVFIKSKGDLMAVYKVLLTHPASAEPQRDKVKWPVEYVISAIRALDLGKVLADLPAKDFNGGIIAPMQSMGQDLFRPAGPDGWSEDGGDWITPATLTARIEWAVALAEEYAQGTDPRALLAEVLGEDVSPELQIAVSGAETKWEGVALLLVSAEFNRR